MTNWMTAAGIALIAGGLATLISFRAMLFGTGGRRARRGSRRRSSVGAFGGRPVRVVAPRASSEGASREVSRSEVARAPGERRDGLASIGLADDEEIAVEDVAVDELADEPPAATYADEPVATYEEAELQPEDEFDAELPIHPAPAPRVDRSDRRYGDRVEGWVRPEYRDLPVEPPSGDYWTPIPEDLEIDPEPSARGYGWPVPVERLPAVPPYEPATGFDLKPIESEPTELVPVWIRAGDERPGRIRLPSSWGARNDEPARIEKPRDAARIEMPREAARIEKPREAARVERRPAMGDKPPDWPTEQRRRPRPRPRPASPADRGAAVYVSRHAAEPPGPATLG